MLQSKGNGKSLYFLYFSIIKTSFGCDIEEEEIKAVTSVMGAMIFAKKPLNNNVLIVLSRVKSQNMLQFIWSGLVSVINKSSIIYYYYYLFIEFILFSFLLQDLPEFSAVQDWDHHEC